MRKCAEIYLHDVMTSAKMILLNKLKYLMAGKKFLQNFFFLKDQKKVIFIIIKILIVRCYQLDVDCGALGWTKMHDVFKSLLPRYFLKDIYVKWSQFEFQTIWSNFHYSSQRSKFLLTIIVLAKFRLKMIFEFFLIKVSQKL